MPDALVKVKALVANYRKWAKASEDEGHTARANRYTRNAENLEAVVEELELSRKRLLSVPTEYGDLSDLPPSVIAQLNLAKIDELEQQMRDIVAAANGKEVGLDSIIIELWRRHKVEQERRFIMNKLYRMAQKGIINSVEGRKGVYYIPQASSGWDSKAGGGVDNLDEDIPF
ncbi:hypothetical protein ACMT1E_01185 [Sphingomonas flavalba]|uniref:hypothetical protein n=1 Tax=Sphingomonas flavalba TaxID=2559804 RepID=UPI0039E1BC5C